MLIIRNPTNVFDTEEIQRGTLIYAKHKSWSKGSKGLSFPLRETRSLCNIHRRSGMSRTTFLFMLTRWQTGIGKFDTARICRRS